MNLLYLLPLVGGLLLLALVPLFLRRVVEPNEVHIVQAKSRTTSYGRGQTGGNSYYDWPSWVPVIGIQTIKLPLANFAIRLDGYEAYDSGRLPFEVDVVAFFRIDNPAQAAERISTIDELRRQLEAILQGAVRTVLAKEDIEKIMSERSTFGDSFTEEVKPHLAEWGVSSVKSIELMDIRDGTEGQAITNIMAKKSSQIEKESRVAVANNKREASVAETMATRDADLAVREADQAVGQRTAQKDQAVGIANEQAKQAIAVEGATTASKNMAVVQVNRVRDAEITREQQVVIAEQEKQKRVIAAEADRDSKVIEATGEQQSTVAIATGHMEAKKLEAVGIQAEGEARADAASKLQVATEVAAQAKLAEVIGSNKDYQTYLIDYRKVEAMQIVGVAQAQALTEADIRVVVQGGTPSAGIENVMDLFTAKGGQNVATMLETFAQTPMGEQLLKRVGIGRPNGEART